MNPCAVATDLMQHQAQLSADESRLDAIEIAIEDYACNSWHEYRCDGRIEDFDWDEAGETTVEPQGSANTVRVNLPACNAKPQSMPHAMPAIPAYLLRLADIQSSHFGVAPEACTLRHHLPLCRHCHVPSAEVLL